MSPRKAIGASAHAAPVGWVHLPGGANAPEGYTVRWRRGETVAYVLPGKQLCSHAIIGVLTTLDVPPHGWIDLEHIRGQGRRWLVTIQARATAG